MCSGEILLAKASRRLPWSIFAAMYSKSFTRTRSGKWSLASMRLMVVADNPEVLRRSGNRPSGAARQTEDVGCSLSDKTTLRQRPTDFRNFQALLCAPVNS
jgi:hypothetical protein